MIKKCRETEGCDSIINEETRFCVSLVVLTACPTMSLSKGLPTDSIYLFLL